MADQSESELSQVLEVSKHTATLKPGAERVPGVGSRSSSSNNNNRHRHLQNSPVVNPNLVLDPNDVQMLMNLGFTRDQVENALRSHNNNVDAAANYLIGAG